MGAKGSTPDPRPSTMTSSTIGHDPTISTLFSDDRVYRYVWTKQITEGNNRICLFVMLNPSTADEYGPDPTIAKCIKFAHKWNCGILVVVNLFALRSTDPKHLKQAANPIGSSVNDLMIRDLSIRAHHAICAWGNHGSLRGRSQQVIKMLQKAGVPLYCLDINASGEPKHPLYIRDSQELSPY